MRVFRIPILLSVFLFAAACTTRESAWQLDAVESYINERPDSALSVLQGMDTTALRTRAQKARYSLLRTMAMDKCYQDISQEQLRPAIAWYARHGTPDEKLKVYHYQGRVLQDRHELSAAAVQYRRAERLVEKARDTHAIGLLYVATASVYRDVYNIPMELSYTRKALEVFAQSGDPLLGSVQGDLALVYHSMEKWEEADSLYLEAIRYSDSNPHAQSVYLSNYARLKVLRPDKDPAGTIALLNRMQALTGGGLSPKEAGAYAYAAELLRETDTVDELLPRLEAMTGEARFDVLPWLARIALDWGDYEKAYHYREEAHGIEGEVIRNALTDSVMRSLYEDAVIQRELSGLRLWRALLAVGLAFLILLAVVLWIGLSKRRVETERDRLLSARDLLQSELQRQDRQVRNLSETADARAASLQQAREAYMRERVARLRQLGKIRNDCWWSERGYWSESQTVAQIRKDFNYIFQSEDGGKSLARRLDQELDGAVSHLRSELHLRENSREVLFLCCCILDLEPELIAEMMKTSKSNVYTKRSRLRGRIRELEDQSLLLLVE